MINHAAFEIESPKLTKHALKVLLWMLALCAVLLGMSGTARASIIPMGADLDQGPYLRTTTTTKPGDADGDNVYGTAGYQIYAISAIGTGPGNNSGPDPYLPVKNAIHLPPYVSSISQGPNTQLNWGAGQTQIDDPTQPPGPSVPKVLSGMLVARIVAGWAPIATIHLTGTVPANFRLGILADVSNSIWDVPGEIEITSSNGDISGINCVALGDLNPDVYFFNVAGASSTDVLTVWVKFGGASKPNDPLPHNTYNAPAIGGFFFDNPASAPPTLATQLATANMTLNENFPNSDLNSAVWSRGMIFPHINGNAEIQAYLPGNVTVANNMCTIHVQHEPTPVNSYDYENNATGGGPELASGLYNYSSGALETFGKFTQAYGYFEAKIRCAGGAGCWPAFWLMPDRGAASPDRDYRTAIGNNYNGETFPMGNEIDVLENMGTWKDSYGYSKGHSGDIWQYNVLGASFGDYNLANQLFTPPVGTSANSLASPGTQFHTYGVMWSPGLVTYYIDGNVVMTGASPNVAVCPMYMILNCAISNDDWSGSGPGDDQINAGLPCTMDIQYVKVYSLPGTAVAGSVNLALNKTAVASSIESSGYPAANAVDSDTTGTRWSSSFSDPQWIYVDLGAVYSINRVKLSWEAAYAQKYQIQVSNDAATWTTIYSTTTGTGGINDLTGLSGSGRYVRMYGTQRGTYFGYSLWNFEVYGPAGGATSMPVANAGFESGVTGGSPAGWQTLSATGYGADAWVMDNANDPGHNFSTPLPGTAEGTHYLNIAGYGSTGREVIYQDITANGLGNGALQPNTTYTLTVAVGEDLYSSPNNGFISLINGTDPTSGATLQTAQMSTLSFGNYADNFKDLSVTFTTPAVITGSGHLTIAIGTQYGWPNYGYVSIDNIRLTKH